ncbi:MAG: hypothetical protein D6712_20965, partial [Chloroflexi bacterium]
DLLLNGNKFWHAGNDGAGSGLDADLLDGQQGSYYLDLANATGVLPVSKGGTGLTTLGTAGQVMKVNASGTALEWGDAGGLNGSGTTDYLPLWTGAASLGNSPISRNATKGYLVNGDRAIQSGVFEKNNNAHYIIPKNAVLGHYNSACGILIELPANGNTHVVLTVDVSGNDNFTGTFVIRGELSSTNFSLRRVVQYGFGDKVQVYAWHDGGKNYVCIGDSLTNWGNVVYARVRDIYFNAYNGIVAEDLLDQVALSFYTSAIPTGASSLTPIFPATDNLIGDVTVNGMLSVSDYTTSVLAGSEKRTIFRPRGATYGPANGTNLYLEIILPAAAIPSDGNNNFGILLWMSASSGYRGTVWIEFDATSSGFFTILHAHGDVNKSITLDAYYDSASGTHRLYFPLSNFTHQTVEVVLVKANDWNGASFEQWLEGWSISAVSSRTGVLKSSKTVGYRGLADGSVTTPSLFFLSDPNTGLYSPTADAIAISTGGTERVRVDNNDVTLTAYPNSRDDGATI